MGLSVGIVVIFGFSFMGMWINGEEIGAPMVKTEQQALYNVIQGFVGEGWNGSHLYPDPCGWTPIQGVSCDLFHDFWHVTDLNIGPLHDNSIPCSPNSQITPHLLQLNHLKSLSFFSCFVSPVGLDSAYFPPTLESLKFRSNPGLTGQIPTAFGQLQNLTSLVLIENGFSGRLPNGVGRLRRLQRLVLSGNRFSGEIPTSYGELSELLILDLSRNSLSGAIPLTFGGLTCLLKLDLSKNKLEGEIPSGIGNLKNLTLLDLSNNRIRVSGGLSFPVSLRELVLSNNPLGFDLVNLNWESLNGLVVLDLSNSGLTGGVPESISGLKRLRFLGLNDNKLSGNLPAKIAELPGLGGLYVNGNNLTGELKFSGEFYRKMGRRFGAWNNSNLCFPIGLIDGPYGVKPCEGEVRLNI